MAGASREALSGPSPPFRFAASRTKPKAMSRALRVARHSFFILAVLAGTAWSATALWLHLEGVTRTGALGALALGAVAAVAARVRRRWLGWAVLALCAALVLAWYQTITPRADRDWAADVSRGVKAELSGDMVTLRDIRDFDWHTPDTATKAWITRTHDLDRLESMEIMTSVWDSPDIAHLLVSFGFEGGRHVVFSVEIRRERGEAFSEIGGFFRQFELVLIAATERDIVRLRTDIRRETVRLFPVDVTPEKRRQMFMAYVDLARDLAREPRFYNTLTANCTTVVFRLARQLDPDLPLHAGLILSGRLPDYLDALGLLAGDGPLAQREAAAVLPADAQAAHPGLTYSEAIRAAKRPEPGPPPPGH